MAERSRPPRKNGYVNVSEVCRRRMVAVRAKDTAPELRVRRLLYAMGIRYRLHVKSMPGRPDIVVPRLKLAIFVHGCFWHGHEACGRAKVPINNAQLWQAKLDATKMRDRRAVDAITSMGWRVVVIWECEAAQESRLRTILDVALNVRE